MEPRTLADIFFLSVAHDLERHVMIKRGAEWQVISSRQLYGYVSTMARIFKQWGLTKGDRVAILSENRPEWMIIDFACVTTGLVDVPIYATLTAEQTLYVLENSGARVVCVSSDEQLKKVQSILSRTKIEKVVVMDDIAEINVIPIWPLLNGSSFEQDAEWEAQAHTISPEDLATLIYTSGTTGNSKGVMLTHGNLTSNANMSTRHAEWRPGDLYLSFLPLSHVTARHLDYVCYQNGVTVAYCPFFDQLPQMLQEAKPTIIVAVPRVYEKVRQEVERQAAGGVKRRIFNWALRVGRRHKAEIERGDTPTSSAWKLADKLVYSKIRQGFGGRSRVYFSGGAPLGFDMSDWFCCMGIPVFEGYGLTETSPVATANKLDIKDYTGSIGMPLPSTDIALRDDDGRIAPAGEAGELCVRGPQVMKGYWNRPEETAKVMDADGWLRTGDIARMDGNGLFYIVDRKKDMILVSGFNVYPNEIEDVVARHPGVLEVAAIGVPDEHSGEVVKLFVVKKDPSLTEEALKKFCHDELTGYKRPKYIEFRKELPKSNVGKILRRELRDEEKKREAKNV